MATTSDRQSTEPWPRVSLMGLELEKLFIRGCTKAFRVPWMDALGAGWVGLHDAPLCVCPENPRAGSTLMLSLLISRTIPGLHDSQSRDLIVAPGLFIPSQDSSGPQASLTPRSHNPQPWCTESSHLPSPLSPSSASCYPTPKCSLLPRLSTCPSCPSGPG